MIELTDRLKREHRSLSDALARLREMDALSRAGQEAMIAAEALFMEHLGGEDDDFYPAFKDLLDEDDDFLVTLHESYRDLAEVSLVVSAFFSKYIGAETAEEFIADFDAMAAQLNDRITREEMVFFPEFDRRRSG